MAMRPSKYRNKPIVVDGIRFASKREAKRWGELKLLEKAKEITELERQTRWALCTEDGVRVGHYVADFTYLQGHDRRVVVEDAKGVRTELYKWKKKHFEAQYGIPITEV